MLNLFYKRRSIRMYKRVQVERESMERLEKAAMLAPTSKGLNASKAIIITDNEMMGKLSRVKAHGSHFLAGVPLAMVVMAEKNISDAWIEDAAIMATFIMLEAEMLGLGSCWVQIRNRSDTEGKSSEDAVRKLLDIPDTTGVLCIIAMGYPAETLPARTEDDLDNSRIMRGKYGA